MSLLDIGKFELFNLKDMLKKVKSKPQSLLGADPLSTKVRNGILGTHDEPLIDQMGGAYGGHTISAFGNKDGGVYERAKAAGIDTKAGGRMQDLAHVVAAIYAGGYGGKQLFGMGGGGGSGGAGGGSSSPASQFSNMPMPQMQRQEQPQAQTAPQFPTNPYLSAPVVQRGPVFRQQMLARALTDGARR